MPDFNFQKAILPLVFLGLTVGAYFLVLSGAVPFSKDASITLTAIAGLATIGAASLRAKIPTLTAGIATIGFGIGSLDLLGMISVSNFVIDISSWFVVVGGVSFLISMFYVAQKRATNTVPV